MKIFSSIKHILNVVKLRGSQLVEAISGTVSSIFKMVDSLRDCFAQIWKHCTIYRDFMGSVLISHTIVSLSPSFLLSILPFPCTIFVAAVSFIFSLSFTNPLTTFLLVQLIGFLSFSDNILLLGSDCCEFFFQFLSIIWITMQIFVDLLYLVMDTVIIVGL